MPEERNYKDDAHALTATIVDRIVNDAGFREKLIFSPVNALREAGFLESIKALETSFEKNEALEATCPDCSRTCGHRSCGKNSCFRSCNGGSVKNILLEPEFLEAVLAAKRIVNR